MRIITYTIVIVAVIVAIYVYIQVSISRIFFKWPTLKDAITGIKSIQGNNIEVDLPIEIENLNPFGIKFSNLYFELKYKDTLIASSKQINPKEENIKEKGISTIKENTIIYLSGDLLNLGAKLISNQTVRIDYRVNMKVYGVKNIEINDYFTYPIK